MARFSKIDRRMWNDAKFNRLSRPQPCGQSLWTYLLTNPAVGPIPGLYSAGAAMLAEALGWSTEAFRESFQELLREGLVKADFQARLLWIPNAIRYNQPENPNVVKGWQCSWDELPECELKREAWEVLREKLSATGNQWVDAFVSVCPEPSTKGSAKGMPKSPASMPESVRKGSAKSMANQEQEQEQEQKQEQEERFCAEPIGSTPAPPVISLPLNDGSEFSIFEDEVKEWTALFPAVDVLQALRNMRAWADANPTRRKTRGGAKRFIVSWLSKEQNNPKFDTSRSGQYVQGPNAGSTRTQRNRAAVAAVEAELRARFGDHPDGSGDR
jgi:hypothetical protein